ncbi:MULTISPECIES: hypothetical protein [Pseudomonas]|uniref:hypothetical protein n=1 Tax=Pseudomonas TaxID=286 RepID=UPI000519A684|nr:MULTISPECIES: hypothetical protein [Pseudomonas]
MPEKLSDNDRGTWALNALECGCCGCPFRGNYAGMFVDGAPGDGDLREQSEARQLPTLTALLTVVRLFLQIHIYLFEGVELFFRQPDSVLKGPLR